MLEIYGTPHLEEVLTDFEVVVIDFYAPWCGPCKMIAPVLEDLEREMPTATFVKVNSEDIRDLADRYGVMSIPTILVVRDGEVVNSSIGFRPKEVIAEMIMDALPVVNPK